MQVYNEQVINHFRHPWLVCVLKKSRIINEIKNLLKNEVVTYKRLKIVYKFNRWTGFTKVCIALEHKQQQQQSKDNRNCKWQNKIAYVLQRVKLMF